MINSIFKNIILLFILLFIQIIILNRIEFSTYINPYIYILFIFILPFETPRWVLLFVGFFMGLFVDVFSNTAGIHAATCTFIAYIRPTVLGYISKKENYDNIKYPSILKNGIYWYLSYISILVFIHHFILFYLEYFRFDSFFSVLFKTILSGFFSVIIIYITQYLFVESKKK